MTIDKEEIKAKLVKFRLDKSREEGVKAYYIFSNKQMEDVVEKLPKSKEELIKCDGFGKVEVEKYGDEILRIIGDTY